MEPCQAVVEGQGGRLRVEEGCTEEEEGVEELLYSEFHYYQSTD